MLPWKTKIFSMIFKNFSNGLEYLDIQRQRLREAMERFPVVLAGNTDLACVLSG